MGALNKILYIIHGWTFNTEKWKPFIENVEKKGIEVNLLKVPGLTAQIDKPWTIDNYVNWLNQNLPSDKKVALLGHSNGGRIAISYSIKYPEKIKHLFLLDSAGVVHNDPITKMKKSIFKKIAKAGKKITSNEGARNFLYRLAQETDYKDANPIMRETMKNLINLDLSLKLSKISIPTTIIWGEKDRVTPFSDALVFKKRIKNSKLFVIEKAKHSPQFTHLDKVVKIVTENI